MSDTFKENYHTIPYTEPSDLSESKVFKFRSWSEFLENLEYRVKTGTNYSRQHASDKEYESDFHSHDSLDDALNEVKLEKTLSHKKSNQVYENVKTHIKLKISDEPMAGVDVPAFLSGQPECFESFVPKKVRTRKKKVDEIFVMVGTNCHVHGDELSNYVKEVMETVYQNFVFRKLVLCHVSDWFNGEPHQFYIDVPYKDVGYILRTAYADFFRRLLFVFHEQHHALPYGYGRSMGEDLGFLRRAIGEKPLLVTFDHREEVHGVK